jgi:hypothetical protein
MVAGVISAVLVAVLVLVAYIGDSDPPTPAFPGWVMVLAPADDAGHEVGIHLTADAAGVAGSSPAVSLDVVVCGKGAFHGILLLGGSAQLLDLRETLPSGATGQSPQEVSALLDSGGKPLQVPGAEQLAFGLPSLAPCPPGAAPGTLGTAVTFHGNLRTRVEHASSLFGITGPRETQSWPTMGRVPGVPASELGALVFPGSPGEWARPRRLGVDVSVGPSPARAELETAQTIGAGTGDLQWEATGPITPTARLVDVESESRWQDGLAAVAFALGIAATGLAVLVARALADRHRPRASVPTATTALVRSPDPPAVRPSAPVTARPPAPPPERPATLLPPREHRGIAVAALAFLIGLLLGRARSR